MKNNLNQIIQIAFLIIIHFVVKQNCLAQPELPSKIKLVSYYSGRWYPPHKKGEYVSYGGRYTLDSCTFELNADKSIYKSSQLFHTNEIIIESTLEKDSIIKNDYNINPISKSVSKDFILSLFNALDTLNYNKHPSDTIPAIIANTIFGQKESLWTIKDFGIDNFISHKSKFYKNCSRNKKNYKSVYENDCTDSTINQFINSCSNRNGLHISSHKIYFRIEIYFKNYYMILNQKYPRGLNSTWRLMDDRSDEIKYFRNTELNDLIYQLAPNHFLYSDKLLEYKKAINKLYFSTIIY